MNAEHEHYRDPLRWWESCPKVVTAEEAQGTDIEFGPDAPCECGAERRFPHRHPHRPRPRRVADEDLRNAMRDLAKGLTTHGVPPRTDEECAFARGLDLAARLIRRIVDAR